MPNSLSWHGQVELVVDEMDAWFDSETFITLGRLVRYIYAQRLTEEVNKLLKKKCIGCQTDSPSETNHICIDPKPDRNPFILIRLQRGINVD
jgi:hypothetical protein